MVKYSYIILGLKRVFHPYIYKQHDVNISRCGSQKLKSIFALTLVIAFLICALPTCKSANTISKPVEWTPKLDGVTHYSNLGSGRIVSVPAYRAKVQTVSQQNRQASPTNNPWMQRQEQSLQAQAFNLPDPKPRHDEFSEKLGFSLSSLLPTSIFRAQDTSQDSANLIGSQSSSNSNNDSPFLDDSELFQSSPLQPSENNPALAPDDSSSEQILGSSDPSQSSGLFTRIRNILPFGSGILSGLRGQSTDTNVGENDFNSITDGSTNFNGNSIPTSGYSSSSSVEDESTGNRFFNAIRNSVRTLQSIFNINVNPSDVGINQQLQPSGYGATTDVANLNGDSTISTLQSFAESTIGSALAPVISLYSTIASTIGLTKANTQLFILLGLALGPIIASAIAATVIGIVYSAIYIPAAAIRNEGLDGELMLLSLNQLFEILGMPNPLEELFDFRKRSLETGPFKLSRERKTALLAGTVHDKNECLERTTCDIVGRKFMQSRKESWLGKGIIWIGRRFQLQDNEYMFRKRNSEILRYAIKLIEAVSTGMSSEDSSQGRDIDSSAKPNQTKNPCVKYVCNPTKELKKLLTLQTLVEFGDTNKKSTNKTTTV